MNCMGSQSREVTEFEFCYSLKPVLLPTPHRKRRVTTKPVKGLKFYPFSVSRILAEDVRLLGQRQKGFIAQQAA